MHTQTTARRTLAIGDVVTLDTDDPTAHETGWVVAIFLGNCDRPFNVSAPPMTYYVVKLDRAGWLTGPDARSLDAPRMHVSELVAHADNCRPHEGECSVCYEPIRLTYTGWYHAPDADGATTAECADLRGDNVIEPT